MKSLDLKLGLKIRRTGGLWWRATAALFGLPNELDRMAQVADLKRKKGWLFWESNGSLRKRILEVLRGDLRLG